MPRSIIDTESSRPAYERRRATIAIVILVAFGLLATGGWFAMVHHAFHTHPVSAVQGKSAH